MMENGKAYFKNMGCLQRKIFEVCFAIFHYYTWKV